VTYELSIEADKDLEDIFDYTHDEFGSAQAVKYVSSFEDLFKMICRNPLVGRNRNEIREELRSISKESHVVFYRLLDHRIRVVRILHGSRDLPGFFDEEEK